MASKAIRGPHRGTGSGIQRLCAALFFCCTPLSLIRASLGDARRTLRHAVRRPLPHRCERRSVYKTPIAHLKCPCVNQVEDLLVFGAFLGLDHGIGHFMLVEVDSEVQAAVPPMPKSPQTSSAASDRKIAPQPSSHQAV
jgi:hypothetical protein